MDYIPLRMGTAGPEVQEAQGMLVHLGYPLGKEDGKFGVRTQRAVIAFQSASELPIDGVVAANTWMALKRQAGSRMGGETAQPEPPVPMMEHISPPLPEQQSLPLIPAELPPTEPPCPSSMEVPKPPIAAVPPIASIHKPETVSPAMSAGPWTKIDVPAAPIEKSAEPVPTPIMPSEAVAVRQPWIRVAAQE